MKFILMWQPSKSYDQGTLSHQITHTLGKYYIWNPSRRPGELTPGASRHVYYSVHRATGFLGYGAQYRTQISEVVRRAAELCDCLQCFFIMHSMGGGIEFLG